MGAELPRGTSRDVILKPNPSGPVRERERERARGREGEREIVKPLSYLHGMYIFSHRRTPYWKRVLVVLVLGVLHDLNVQKAIHQQKNKQTKELDIGSDRKVKKN